MLIHVKELIYYLGLHVGSVVSVVGSGGKTTLIDVLAKELAGRCRVCVAATTKMKYPGEGLGPLVLKESLAAAKPPKAPGIYYIADELTGTGKMHGFSQELADWALKHTDILLIEADGSHKLPLKGWSDDEPVVIKETQITIGIMPVYLLGEKIGEKNIHRFPIFSELTGAREGDVLTREHLIRAIISPKGLFGKAQGEKVLFFSQVSDEAMEDEANAIAGDERLDFIDKIMIGSLKP